MLNIDIKTCSETKRNNKIYIWNELNTPIAVVNYKRWFFIFRKTSGKNHILESMVGNTYRNVFEEKYLLSLLQGETSCNNGLETKVTDIILII